MRIVFAGTPEFSALHLKAIVDSKHQLTAVYTQPDRPAGRGKKPRPSAVKELALAAGLTVHQPESLKTQEAQDTLAALQADVMIVVAYGLILPQEILVAPTFGCLNVHASLLPRWRGAAPIQRAIEAGDSETGITIMQMDQGLDTGEMLATQACTIGNHSAASLHDELATLGAPLLLEVLERLPHYQEQKKQQNEAEATYAHKIHKAEGAIDWTLSARDIEKKIRAFNPFPVCYAELETTRIRIWEAQATPTTQSSQRGCEGTIIETKDSGIVVSCGRGELVITALQLPGGKVLSTQQVLSARREQFKPGLQFSCSKALP